MSSHAGFEPRLSDWGTRRVLWLDSDRLSEGLEYAERQLESVDAVGLNAVYGFRSSSLGEVLEHTKLRGLIMVGVPPGLDLSGLQRLRDLRVLVTHDTTFSNDLSWFPKLEEYRGPWHKDLGLENCRSLATLSLTSYRPSGRDLASLCHLDQLRELRLTRPGVTSLRGVRSLTTLEILDVAYAQNLVTVQDAEALPHLREAVFQNCPKLADHSRLGECGTLRSLQFTRCGVMPSLAFLDSMRQLEHFSFVGTNVVDGDMRPLLRLRSTGFDSRKHYSHTCDEVSVAVMRNASLRR